MAFDPSRLVAALAPAAGALAAPGDPRLGASVASGLASALLPSPEERQAAAYNEKRLAALDLDMAASKQRMEATKQDMEFNAVEAGRKEKLFPLEERRAVAQASSAETESATRKMVFEDTQGRLADARVQPFAEAGGSQAFAELAPLLSNGLPMSEQDQAAWKAQPMVKQFLGYHEFLNVARNADFSDPLQRAAVTRFGQRIGLAAGFEGSELVIESGFSAFDPDGDGRVTPDEINAMKTQLASMVKREAGFKSVRDMMSTKKEGAQSIPHIDSLFNAYRDAGAKNPHEMSINHYQSITQSIGQDIIAAAQVGEVIDNALMAGDEDTAGGMAAQYQPQFAQLGINARMSPNGLEIMIPQSHKWTKDQPLTLVDMKASAGDRFRTEGGMYVFPARDFSRVVQQQVADKVAATAPRKNPIDDAFESALLDPTIKKFTDKDEATGQEVVRDSTIGAELTKLYAQRVRETLAGEGNTEAKLTADDFESFGKSPEGRAIRAELLREAGKYANLPNADISGASASVQGRGAAASTPTGMNEVIEQASKSGLGASKLKAMLQAEGRPISKSLSSVLDATTEEARRARELQIKYTGRGY